jgi:hypothetical protein
LITLRALARRAPPQVAAAIVSSPFLALSSRCRATSALLASVASRLVPKLSQPSAPRRGLDPGQTDAGQRIADKLCFDIATARWFTDRGRAETTSSSTPAGSSYRPHGWWDDDPIADPARSQAVASRSPVPAITTSSG